MNLREYSNLRDTARLLLCVVIGCVALGGCGGGTTRSTGTPTTMRLTKPSTGIAVQVGHTAITGSAYDHWMAVGAATVEMPKASGPLPEVIAYQPPNFTACVDHLRKGSTKTPATSPLRAECQVTYEDIRRRILNFLITGDWLRGAAAEKGLLVTPAAVKKKFQEERLVHYTPNSFRRLQRSSRQTIGDLEFAVETQMLSARLLEAFLKEHHRERSEHATIAAFNKSIKRTWIPKTNCHPGYVIPDCRQYRG
jgi:hypothetical protein